MWIWSDWDGYQLVLHPYSNIAPPTPNRIIFDLLLLSFFLSFIKDSIFYYYLNDGDTGFGSLQLRFSVSTTWRRVKIVCPINVDIDLPNSLTWGHMISNHNIILNISILLGVPFSRRYNDVKGWKNLGEVYSNVTKKIKNKNNWLWELLQACSHLQWDNCAGRVHLRPAQSGF